MLAGMPNDAGLTPGQKAARRRKGIAGLVGFFVLMSGVPPLSGFFNEHRK
jgi:hypothetical protein